MKRLILWCGIVLALTLLCGCPQTTPSFKFYSRSFVLEYGRVSDISIWKSGFNSSNAPGSPSYYYIYVDFETDKHCDAINSGEKKQLYDALCEKYGDVTYNRRVRLSYNDSNPRCFQFFTDLQIWSTADWDSAHPAGIPLGDLVRFRSDTPLPYIRSGYTKTYSDKKGGEYYPVDKFISELTTDDMTLLPSTYFYLQFTSRPTLDQHHTLHIRMTADDGQVFETSVDVDFSQQPE